MLVLVTTLTSSFGMATSQNSNNVYVYTTFFMSYTAVFL